MILCVKTLFYKETFFLQDLYEDELSDKGFEIHSATDVYPNLLSYDLENYDLLMYEGEKVTLEILRVIREVRVVNPVMGIVCICDILTKQDLMELYRAGVDKVFLDSTDIDIVVAELRSFKRRLETLNYRLTIGDVSFNVAQQYVEKDNKIVHLNPTEAKLLLRLADSTADNIVTNNEIIHLLNQATGYDSSRGTKVYIYRIRKKLNLIHANKIEIKNKYSNGYYLRVEE